MLLSQAGPGRVRYVLIERSEQEHECYLYGGCGRCFVVVDVDVDVDVDDVERFFSRPLNKQS